MKERNVRFEITVVATLLIAVFVINALPTHVPTWFSRTFGRDAKPVDTANVVKQGATAAPRVNTDSATAAEKDRIDQQLGFAMQQRGILVLPAVGDADASFLELATSASKETLDSIGFLPVLALKDSATTVELFGKHIDTVRLAPVAALDSIVRKSVESGICFDAIPTNFRVRAAAPPNSLWNFGLRAGAIERLPIIYPFDSDSAAGVREATRIIESLIVPDSSPIQDSVPPPYLLFAGKPYTVHLYASVAFGSLEVVAIDASRLSAHPRSNGARDSVRFAQSVYLIAERPHGSRAAFRLAHSNQRVIDPDNVGDHGLSLAGRVRQSGKPLLVFEYAAEYGSAGDFLVRNADGTWTLVGGWASACD